MLKPQDVVILLKILSIMAVARTDIENERPVSQNKLATLLCMSASEINAGIKRLVLSGLLSPVHKDDPKNKMVLLPNKLACEELLTSAIKYFFPAQLGTYTQGIATSYAAPIFEKCLTLGKDPIPVWPYIRGDKRGLALEPLYKSVPKSLDQFPDKFFYELLVLVDAIRSGKARERAIAIKLLKDRIYAKQ